MSGSWSSSWYLGLTSCQLFRTLFAPRLNYCSRYWITPPVKPSGYCLPIEDHACWLEYSSVLSSIYLFATVWTRPVITMPLSNKALQMDPHSSRLVSPITTIWPFKELKHFDKLLIEETVRAWSHSKLQEELQGNKSQSKNQANTNHKRAFLETHHTMPTSNEVFIDHMETRGNTRSSVKLNLNVQVKQISIVAGNWWIDLYVVKIAKSLLVIYLW